MLLYLLRRFQSTKARAKEAQEWVLEF